MRLGLELIRNHSWWQDHVKPVLPWDKKRHRYNIYI